MRRSSAPVHVPQPGLPDASPIVVAQIRAPAPAESPEPQFGTPIWVKVHTTEYESMVALEDLPGGAPMIEATEVEMEWQLPQTEPGNPLSSMLENGGLAPVGDGAESVVRRYEFYRYIGALKAEDNEALPIFGDSHADASEVGDFIGAQNAAININGPLLAAPEPASWASMGLGLLLLGALLLRWQAGAGAAFLSLREETGEVLDSARLETAQRLLSLPDAALMQDDDEAHMPSSARTRSTSSTRCSMPTAGCACVRIRRRRRRCRPARGAGGRGAGASQESDVGKQPVAAAAAAGRAALVGLGAARRAAGGFSHAGTGTRRAGGQRGG